MFYKHYCEVSLFMWCYISGSPGPRIKVAQGCSLTKARDHSGLSYGSEETDVRSSVQIRGSECHDIHEYSPVDDRVDRLRLSASRLTPNPPLTACRIGLLLQMLANFGLSFWVGVLRRWCVMKKMRSTKMIKSKTPPMAPPIMAALCS